MQLFLEIVSDAKSNNDKQEVADETIEKILPNLEMSEIQMQGLENHIHESDAQSNNDKQEVADVTIEKILPNLEMNEIQMQEQIVAVHDSDVMSDDDICDVDEIIEKVLPMNNDENKIRDQKRSHDLIQMPEIDSELNQPFKKSKLGNLLVYYSDSSESDTSQIDEEPEETYNNKTELVEEDVAGNNLKYDHKFDKKHDALTTKSSACRICGSTFPTVQELMKHISGNLHDFYIYTQVQNVWS